MIAEKFCSYHKETHPIKRFSRRADTKDGYATLCKAAHRLYATNPDPTTAYRRGKRRSPARSEDRRQAQRRIQTLIEAGLKPHPNTQICNDCHLPWDGTKKNRIEYDHDKGYAPEFHEVVVTRCVRCHKKAEALRTKSRRVTELQEEPAF